MPFVTRITAIVLEFLRPAGVDLASMGAGLTGGILGMGNAEGLPNYSGFQPGAAIEMDEKWYRAMQAIERATDRNTGMVDPVLLESFSNMLGIDLNGLVSAGGIAGQQYAGLGQMAGGAGAQMQDQAQGAFGRGQDIWNTARDPQNQLHDYMRQQTVEGSRAADSARGLAMSPYSAGHESDATRRFEMDWQNQQLGRQMAGGQAANQAGGFGAGALGASMGYYGMQPEFTQMSAQAPIAGQEAAYGRPMDYASQFTAAQGQNVIGPQMQMQQQINPYLGLAGQTGNWASQYGLNQANLHNQMQQQSQYGLWGGGQSQTPFMGGNQSGAGNPMNGIMPYGMMA
jgi:hypothetical protein